MNYKGYKIDVDTTGYAPKNMIYYFYEEGADIVVGFGKSAEDCKIQIDEIILESYEM